MKGDSQSMVVKTECLNKGVNKGTSFLQNKQKESKGDMLNYAPILLEGAFATI
jgi:hypothetical protein